MCHSTLSDDRLYKYYGKISRRKLEPKPSVVAEEEEEEDMGFIEFILTWVLLN